jgi:hypothetical protein
MNGQARLLLAIHAVHDWWTKARGDPAFTLEQGTRPPGGLGRAVPENIYLLGQERGRLGRMYPACSVLSPLIEMQVQGWKVAGRPSHF